MHSFELHRVLLSLSLMLCCTTGCNWSRGVASRSGEPKPIQTVDLKGDHSSPAILAVKNNDSNSAIRPVTHQKKSEPSTLNKIWEKTTSLPRIALPKTSDESLPLDDNDQFQEL